MVAKIKVLESLERTRLIKLADEWLDDVKVSGSLRTVASYEWPVKKLLIPWMEAEGITDPAKLDQATLNRFSNSLVDGNRARASIASYGRQCNVWIRWCAKQEGRNNVAGVKWQKVEKKTRVVLTLEEIRGLIDAATTVRDGLIVRTLAETGMRLGEMLRLTTEDVLKHPKGGQLHVSGSENKTREDRNVPITRELYRELMDYIDKKRPKETRSKALFLTNRRARGGGGLYVAVSKRTVETLFKSLADSAGIKPDRVHPHALRHSLATRSQQRGADSVSPVQMAAALGHTPAVFMKTYSHLEAEDAREALAGLLED